MASTTESTIDVYRDLQTKGQRLNFNSATPFVPSFVTSSVTQASNPEEIYANRIHGRKILLENPARESRTRKELVEKRQRRNAHKEKTKLGIIGRKEAKEKGVWKLDESQAKFSLFLPLHHLWMGYMSELLGLIQPPATPRPPTAADAATSATIHPKLVKADFHGSIITVRQSKCPSLLGISGIVIHESENTLRVVTRDDKVKILPKQSNIFTVAIPLYSTLPASHTSDSPLPTPSSTDSTVFDLPYMEFQLYGNQFRFRSADRAGRKFKHKETIEL